MRRCRCANASRNQRRRDAGVVAMPRVATSVDALFALLAEATKPGARDSACSSSRRRYAEALARCRRRRLARSDDLAPRHRALAIVAVRWLRLMTVRAIIRFRRGRLSRGLRRGEVVQRAQRRCGGQDLQTDPAAVNLRDNCFLRPHHGSLWSLCDRNLTTETQRKRGRRRKQSVLSAAHILVSPLRIEIGDPLAGCGYRVRETRISIP